MSESIWDRIESARARWNVLEHPFYQRWSAGELSREELARYSGQYRHAVEAVATISADVAEARAGARRAAQPRAPRRPLTSSSGTASSPPPVETRAPSRPPRPPIASTPGPPTTASSPDLARLYAIESGQPAISKTKREGLLERYGFADGAGTAYFRVHETRDVEHAAETRELIDELAGAADADAIVAEAESAFRANWRLLDGV